MCFVKLELVKDAALIAPGSETSQIAVVITTSAAVVAPFLPEPASCCSELTTTPNDSLVSLVAFLLYQLKQGWLD